MSSKNLTKLFTVIVPDIHGTISKRIQVRDAHLLNARKLNEKGILVTGGAYFSEHPSEGETPDFKGSILTINATSPGEVKKILEADIYTSSGVWDVKKATILPCIVAVK